MSATEPKDTRTVGGRCPICGAPTVHAVRPFCSRRCADIDLGRWISGAYVIRATGGDDADEDGESALAQTAATGLPEASPDGKSR